MSPVTAEGRLRYFPRRENFCEEVMFEGKGVSDMTFGDKDFKTCFVTLQDTKGMEKFRTDIPGR